MEILVKEIRHEKQDVSGKMKDLIPETAGKNVYLFISNVIF